MGTGGTQAPAHYCLAGGILKGKVRLTNDSRVECFGKGNLGGFGLRWLRTSTERWERTRASKDPMYVLCIYKGLGFLTLDKLWADAVA